MWLQAAVKVEEEEEEWRGRKEKAETGQVEERGFALKVTQKFTQQQHVPVAGTTEEETLFLLTPLSERALCMKAQEHLPSKKSLISGKVKIMTLKSQNNRIIRQNNEINKLK